jgi:hypothetical protein
MVYKTVSASTSKVIDIMKPKSILRKFAPGSANFGRKRTAEKKCTFQKEHSEQIYDVSDPQDQFWHTDQPKIDSRTGKPVQIHNPEIVEFENRSWIDEGYQFPEVKREMHRDTYNYRFDKRHEGLQTLQQRIEKFAEGSSLKFPLTGGIFVLNTKNSVKNNVLTLRVVVPNFNRSSQGPDACA